MGDGVHGDKPPVEEEQGKTKTCPKCGETKELGCFGRHSCQKDGLRCWCKICERSSLKSRREANKLKAAKTPAVKKCYKCGLTKAGSDFAKDRSNSDGLRYDCKVCSIAATKSWVARNPHKRKRQKQLRRARKANAKGDFTAEQWKARLAYHGYKCVYCGVEKHETPQGWLTCEHLIPLARGGSNWPSNLAPSCQSCNCSKGTRTHFEYLEYLNEKEV